MDSSDSLSIGAGGSKRERDNDGRSIIEDACIEFVFVAFFRDDTSERVCGCLLGLYGIFTVSSAMGVMLELVVEADIFTRVCV